MDHQEKKALVEKFIPFCRKEAYVAVRRGYGRRLGGVDDCFSEAVLILYSVIDKFDPSYGVKFLTYATTSVRRHLQNLADQCGVVVPKRTGSDLCRAAAARARSTAVLDPTDSALASESMPHRPWFTDTLGSNVEDALKMLTPFQEKVIRCYYERGLRGRRLLQAFGHGTMSNVNQTHRAALARLQKLHAKGKWSRW